MILPIIIVIAIVIAFDAVVWLIAYRLCGREITANLIVSTVNLGLAVCFMGATLYLRLTQ